MLKRDLGNDFNRQLHTPIVVDVVVKTYAQSMRMGTWDKNRINKAIKFIRNNIIDW